MKEFNDIINDVIQGDFVRNLGLRASTLAGLSDIQRQHLLYVLARHYAANGLNYNDFKGTSDYKRIQELLPYFNLGQFESFFLPTPCRELQEHNVCVKWEKDTRLLSRYRGGSIPPFRVVEGSDIEFQTALHFAVQNRSSFQTLQWLIQFGVPVDAIMHNAVGRETALDMALRLGNREIATALVNFGASLGPIDYRAFIHPFRSNCLLRNHLAEMNNSDPIFSSLLHLKELEDRPLLSNASLCQSNDELTPIKGNGPNELPKICQALVQTFQIWNFLKRVNEPDPSFIASMRKYLLSEPTHAVMTVLSIDFLRLNFTAPITTTPSPLPMPATLMEIITNGRGLECIGNLESSLPLNCLLIKNSFYNHLLFRFLLINSQLNINNSNITKIVEEYELNPLDFADYQKSQQESANAATETENAAKIERARRAAEEESAKQAAANVDSSAGTMLHSVTPRLPMRDTKHSQDVNGSALAPIATANPDDADIGGAPSFVELTIADPNARVAAVAAPTIRLIPLTTPTGGPAVRLTSAAVGSEEKDKSETEAVKFVRVAIKYTLENAVKVASQIDSQHVERLLSLVRDPLNLTKTLREFVSNSAPVDRCVSVESTNDRPSSLLHAYLLNQHRAITAMDHTTGILAEAGGATPSSIALPSVTTGTTTATAAR